MASKRHLRRKACDGKVRHEDQTGAVKAILGMKRIGMVAHGEVRSYRCKFCHGWHVGHPPKGK